MPRFPAPPAVRVLIAVLLCTASSAAQSGAPDPFQSGLRWAHSPDPLDPWIPRDVVLVGDGEFTLAAPAVANPSVEFFASAEIASGGVAPLAASQVLTGAIGPVRLAAGDEPDELFDAAQYPAPTGSMRSTVVSRRNATLGAGLVPLWSIDLGLRVNGPARIVASPDGGVLEVAVFDATTSRLHLVALEPSDGTERWSVDLPASGLAALELADSGARTAAAAGSYQYVWDANGGVLFARQDASAPSAMSISGDGARIAFGTRTGIEVWEDLGAGFGPLTARTAAPDEVAIRAELSADGGTLAVLWWNVRNGLDVRVEILDAGSGALLGAALQSGAGVVGLQNFPAALAITPDGSRVAVGLWGTGDGRPEVLLLERAGAGVVLAEDLPGSVEALALSGDGTRLAVARRDNHANVFSTTGTLEFFDTGERDLQLLGASRPGGSLDLAFQLPEPGDALFAIGTELSAPNLLPLGPIWIDFNRTHVLRSVAGPTQRAVLGIAVPLDPALVGARFAAQALALVPAGAALSRTVVRPRIL